MKTTFFIPLLALATCMACEVEPIVPPMEEVPPQQYDRSRQCVAYVELYPWDNTAYIGSDDVELAYNTDVVYFRSPYRITDVRVYNPADCGTAIESIDYGQEYNYYTCDIVFTEDFINCTLEERQTEAFFLWVYYDCHYTQRSIQNCSHDFGGWKPFIDSVGSRLDGMTIQGQYINIEGIPALGVLDMRTCCHDHSLYLDWVPHSNESADRKLENCMSNCTGVFTAQLDDGRTFDFVHDTDRQLYNQPPIFMAGDVLEVVTDYEYLPDGRSIVAPLSDTILAAAEATGFLFFALGHE